MKRIRRLGRDRRGVSAVEFAFAIPLLLGFVLGLVQLGNLFFAHADVRHAVAAGARLASIFPRPTEEEIVARINARVTGLDPEAIEGPSVDFGTDANGNDFADIEMRYSMPLDFIFFRTPPVILTETRRVFTQPEEG